jgi:hypothetical protein
MKTKTRSEIIKIIVTAIIALAALAVLAACGVKKAPDEKPEPTAAVIDGGEEGNEQGGDSQGETENDDGLIEKPEGDRYLVAPADPREVWITGSYKGPELIVTGSDTYALIESQIIDDFSPAPDVEPVKYLGSYMFIEGTYVSSGTDLITIKMDRVRVRYVTDSDESRQRLLDYLKDNGSEQYETYVACFENEGYVFNEAELGGYKKETVELKLDKANCIAYVAKETHSDATDVQTTYTYNDIGLCESCVTEEISQGASTETARCEFRYKADKTSNLYTLDGYTEIKKKSGATVTSEYNVASGNATIAREFTVYDDGTERERQFDQNGKVTYDVEKDLGDGFTRAVSRDGNGNLQAVLELYYDGKSVGYEYGEDGSVKKTVHFPASSIRLEQIRDRDGGNFAEEYFDVANGNVPIPGGQLREKYRPAIDGERDAAYVYGPAITLPEVDGRFSGEISLFFDSVDGALYVFADLRDPTAGYRQFVDPASGESGEFDDVFWFDLYSGDSENDLFLEFTGFRHSGSFIYSLGRGASGGERDYLEGSELAIVEKEDGSGWYLEARIGGIDYDQLLSFNSDKLALGNIEAGSIGEWILDGVPVEEINDDQYLIDRYEAGNVESAQSVFKGRMVFDGNENGCEFY